MSQVDSPVEPTDSTPIPTMLTNSGRAIMDHFGEQIIELKGDASKETRNKDELLRDYGLMREHAGRDIVSIDYRQITDRKGNPENELTEDAVSKIIQQITSNMPEYDDDTQVDLSIDKMVVVVESPEIRRVTEATSNEFEMTFVSDPAEDAQATKEANVGKGMYALMNFEYRNLNLRSVCETKAKYAEQSDASVMGWGGPDDPRPRCNKRLAQAVYEMLPEEFSALKWYKTGAEDTIELSSIQTEVSGDD